MDLRTCRRQFARFLLPAALESLARGLYYNGPDGHGIDRDAEKRPPAKP